jgi:hypothetical protein
MSDMAAHLCNLPRWHHDHDSAVTNQAAQNSCKQLLLNSLLRDALTKRARVTAIQRANQCQQHVPSDEYVVLQDAAISEPITLEQAVPQCLHVRTSVCVFVYACRNEGCPPCLGVCSAQI